MRITLLSVVGVAAIAQLVPYGRDHTNPPIVAEPRWDAASTRELAKRACFDCHSNETRWPWYSHVAPASWFLQRDVDEGREILNFSEWNRTYDEAGESAETVRDRSMPPASYLLLHPKAKLSAVERRDLARGLAATLGSTESSQAD